MKSLARLIGIAVVSTILSLSGSAYGQPFWSQYGGNAQHTAEVASGVQSMNQILWQTPEDLYPPVVGTDLFIHYGSPLVSTGGTVVVTVRNGPNADYPTTNDTYQIEGHSLGTGTTLWTQTSDYTDWMPHDWTPSFGSAIEPNNEIYTPGAGGTVWVRSNADSASATVTRECFYGLSNYTANESECNENVQIDTPITADSSGNIYFGFYVTAGWTSGNPAQLANGIAKISSTGVGTWVTAAAASGNGGDEVAVNAAPAVSNDGKYVYVAVKQTGFSNYNNPKLLRLNTSNLSTASSVSPVGPSGTFAYIYDDGTASPMVGPDGDLYFGVWYSNLSSRGFMLHYSSDLSTSKPAGAFGWDDTASVVPASAVPSYSGTSAYLILTKYNNYSDFGDNGDGENKVAVLDPNATENYTVQYGPAGNPPNSTGPTYVCMKEILTVLGPTPASNGIGVDEWCINMAAVDVAGKSAVINSEDGHAYRWDFTTNTLTQAVDLNEPTAEAYTPTITGPGGIAFTVNDASLYALWDGAKPVTLSSSTLVGGSSSTEQLSLSGEATGPGATVQLSSSNPSVQVPSSVLVPAGSDSATFTVSSSKVSANQTATITANRYGFTTTGTATVLAGVLNVSVSPSSLIGGANASIDLNLTGHAGTVGIAVSLKSSSTDVQVPASVTVPSGFQGVSAKITTSGVGTSVSATITATAGASSAQTTLTLAPSILSFSISPTSVSGGSSATCNLNLAGHTGSGGEVVSLASSSANLQVPSTVTIAGGYQGTSFKVTTSQVTTTQNVTITATLGASSKQTVVTLTPSMAILNFSASPASVVGGSSTTLDLNLTEHAGTGGVVITLESSSPSVQVPATVTVPAGYQGVAFTAASSAVKSSTSAMITATLGSSSQQVTITLTP